MNSDAKLLKTNDGSDTIFLSNIEEHYHSTHGAVQESEHVYIKSGLEYYLEHNNAISEINIFEVGMGTGLNVILTFLWAIEHNIKINFITLEPFPLSWELMKNYSLGKLKQKSKASEYFQNIHNSNWEEKIELHSLFTLTKIKEKIENYKVAKNFQLVFYDAFAPNKQAGIWNAENLNKVYSSLTEGGILTTYCAKGSVRRDFKSAGFEVQRIAGPPGKREILRCLKQ